MAGTATPKIYAALQGVMEDIKSLEKNGAAPKAMGGYKFLAVDDVLKEVRPHLVKHKIIVLPQLVNTDNHVIQQDGGRISTKVFLTFDFHFVSTEDGSEVVVTVVGEANDTGDKTDEARGGFSERAPAPHYTGHRERLRDRFRRYLRAGGCGARSAAGRGRRPRFRPWLDRCCRLGCRAGCPRLGRRPATGVGAGLLRPALPGM